MRKYEVHLDIDTRCNYNCRYCWCSKDALSEADRKAQAPLPLERLTAVLPKLDALCWHVFLSCAGEPFMHPRWQDVADTIAESRISSDLTLVTNGRLMTPDRAEGLVRAGVTRLYVSIDSVDPPTYAWLCRCREADLEAVSANVQELVRIRGSRPFPRIFVTAIVMKSTREGLPAVARWVTRHGLDGLKTQWLEAERAPGLDREIVGNDDRTRAALAQTEAVLREAGATHDFPYINSLQKLRSVVRGSRFVRNKTEYYRYWVAKFRQSRTPGGCRLAGLSMNLRQDGVLQMCPQSSFAAVDLLACPTDQVRRAVAQAVQRFRAAPVAQCEGCALRNRA